MDENSNGVRVLRINQVCHWVGLSRSTVWRRLKQGQFPHPIKLGPKAVGWRSDEISAWIRGRERAIGLREKRPQGALVWNVLKLNENDVMRKGFD